MTTAVLEMPELAARPVRSRGRSRAGWGLAGLLAVALLVRVPGLSASIWFDEYYRTFVKMRPENLYALLFQEVHNFLYNGFMYVWIRVFGDADWVIRVPTLVAGCGASLVFWRWVTRRWGSAVGWWVLAWALLSPAHIWYTTEAKNSMFSVLFATCILVSYDRMLGEPGRRRWVAAAVASGVLGIFTDFVTLLALLPVVMVGVWEVMRGGGAGALAAREGRRVLALAVTATLAITMPFLLFKLGQEEDLLRDYLKHFNLRQAHELLCGYLLNGNAIFPGRPQRQYLALAASPLVLGLLAVGLWRARGDRPGRMVAACFVLPIVFFFVASARIKATHDDGLHWIYQHRNLLILLHPFGLLMMLGAASLPRAKWRGVAAGTVLAFNVAGTGMMLTVHADRATVAIPKPDWRGMTRLLDEDAAARGERMVVFSRVWCEPVHHYTTAAEERRPAVHRFRPLAPGYKYVLAYMKRYGAGAFYCVDDRISSPLSEEERARLAAWFDTEATWEFGWMRIHRMSPRPEVLERYGDRDLAGE